MHVHSIVLEIFRVDLPCSKGVIMLQVTKLTCIISYHSLQSFLLVCKRQVLINFNKSQGKVEQLSVQLEHAIQINHDKAIVQVVCTMQTNTS